MADPVLRHLILVRHAHRDNSVRAQDNGLSELGAAQALKLCQTLTSRFELSDCVWESSPKKRCVETLLPAAKNLLQISELLDEQKSDESVSEFDQRISKYLEDWRNSSEAFRIACSHGDWIPEAIFKLTRLKTELSKSGYVVLSIDQQGRVTIEDLVLSIDLVF